jgi:transcriptional regulator with XRE-family HTH domain
MNAYEIKKFRDEHNMSQSQLAELLGTSVRAVQSWEQGVRNISQSSEKLLKVYSKEHIVSPDGSKKDISALYEEHFKSTKNGVPFYGELPVSCGQMQLAAVLSNEKPTGYVDIPGLSAIAFFPAIGFSFEPIIKPGDHVGIREINKWESFDPDKIYLIITTEDRMAKKIRPCEDEGYIWCISTNMNEFRIPKSEVKSIYHIVYCGRFV